MTIPRFASHSEGQAPVVALINGPAERFLIDTTALLMQEFPSVGGPAFKHAAAELRARFRDEAVLVLQDMMHLLSEMRLIGSLPRLRLGRTRPAGKDEVFYVALLAALQRGDKGRAIEAAIALLDTGYVHGVILAARSLARRYAQAGLLLRPVGGPMFDYFAGYPSLAEAPSVALTLAEVGRPRRPVLRLLQSA